MANLLTRRFELVTEELWRRDFQERKAQEQRRRDIQGSRRQRRRDRLLMTQENRFRTTDVQRRKRLRRRLLYRIYQKDNATQKQAQAYLHQLNEQNQDPKQNNQEKETYLLELKRVDFKGCNKEVEVKELKVKFKRDAINTIAQVATGCSKEVEVKELEGKLKSDAINTIAQVATEKGTMLKFLLKEQDKKIQDKRRQLVELKRREFKADIQLEEQATKLQLLVYIMKTREKNLLLRLQREGRELARKGGPSRLKARRLE